MITPSYSLASNTYVLPVLALDFTTALLDSRITFTRTGNTATYINSSGTITAINADLPRFDYNPSTLVCQGLLIEESRKNIVLNSLINGTNLATQSVTSSAVAYTLSFYGTGSIVLSGTHSATVTGTAAYPTRKTYTFTPTAGTLTLTVSGTVQYAQLEAGAFATSFIPTDSTAGGITRNADTATMTGTNFSNWFNSTQGAFQYTWQSNGQTNGTQRFGMTVSDGSSNNRIRSFVNSSTTQVTNQVTSATSTVASLNNTVTASTGVVNKTSLAYKVNDFAASSNASTPATDLSGAVPTGINQGIIGADVGSTGYLNGWMQKINYWPQKLTTAEVQAFSK